MRHILKASLVSTAAIFISSCGTVGTAPSIGSDIVGDALSLNQAYGEASNAVILKNILRARDRWPTTYTTLSAIESSPSLQRAGAVSLTPLGLGNAAGPFKNSGSSFSNTSKAGNNYKVVPFVDGVMNPMKGETFENYFDRWPRDVAVLMLINGLKVEEAGRPRLIRNDGEDIEGFVMNIARAFHLSEAQYRSFDVGKHLDLVKSDSGEYALAVRSNKDLQFTPQQQGIRHEFELRSIDSIIYFLGETLRTPQNAISVNCDVRTPSGYQTIKMKAPILKVDTPQNAQRVNYAMRVNHAGQTYFALPNATQIESRGGCLKERSSTAIAMLTQLLLLSQDEDAFKGTQTLTLR